VADRVLTAELAEALQAESAAEGELLMWVVASAEGEVVARPVTAGRGALAYVLVADTLTALRALLPAGLVRVPCMPGRPEGVIEVWCRQEA
jgi:hypothetical protein